MKVCLVSLISLSQLSPSLSVCLSVSLPLTHSPALSEGLSRLSNLSFSTLPLSVCLSVSLQQGVGLHQAFFSVTTEEAVSVQTHTEHALQSAMLLRCPQSRDLRQLKATKSRPAILH